MSESAVRPPLFFCEGGRFLLQVRPLWLQSHYPHMFINVLYFGSLREELGRAGDSCTLPGDARVVDVWHLLNPGKPLPEKILCAINQEYVKAHAHLCDGDELAFFPPVTGG